MARIILVPTPIGNLGDITMRALEVLRTASLIACEDTRHTRVLLNHYQITTPTTALHMHNEHARVEQLLQQVAGQNMTLAVVSDAGTPGISDPGFLLARAAVAQGIPLEVLPGPTALVPALVLSALPLHRFCFEGFLPPKKGRHTRLTELAAEQRTMVLYEAPHRMARTVADLATHLGPDRPAALVRELTKLHETTLRLPLQQLAAQLEKTPAKGECVLVVAGADYRNTTFDSYNRPDEQVPEK